MKARQIFGLACLLLVPVSLLLARVHPYGDASLYVNKTPAVPFMQNAHVPPDVRSILAEKCADCHSSEVRTPIYGRFAPMSWLMEADIVRGRKAMNLAMWNSYSPGKRSSLSQQIVQMTRKGEMPLLQYRLIHWKSRISSTDLAALTRWSQANGSAAAAASGGAALGGEARMGEELFNKRCSGCHSLTKDGEGPRLGNVYGRAAGSVPTFTYSTALKNAHITWSDDTLDKWLTNPDALVAGNEMDFNVEKPEERQQIIRFLKSQMQ
jgi:cytochrome c